MSPPRPVDMGSVRLSTAAAATAASAALPPSRRIATPASEAKRWLVAAIPDVTAPPCGADVPQPRASGSEAAPARNSRREGIIFLLYAGRGEDGGGGDPSRLVLAVLGLGEDPVERGSLGGHQVLE